MSYGIVNSDLMTTSDGVSSAGLYGFKNKIFNGDMRIDQRNAGASVTVNSGAANFFACDRFSATGQATDGVFTIQQSSTAPTGFINSMVATVTTADASVGASQYYIAARQKIEGLNIADLGWGTANAATVTLSFWIRSSLTGTFGGSLLNSAQNRSYPFTYTISSANTWEQKSITIAGDTTGTWLTTNGVGIDIIWSIGMGSTLSGTAGSWAGATYFSATGATNLISTNSATFYITGVQLEKGSTATSFDYRPYGTELQLCQRYFESTAFPDVPGIGITSTRIGICLTGATTSSSGFNFLVPKRTNAPTVTLYSRSGTSGKVSLVATGADVAGTSSAASINGTGFWGVSLGAAQTAGAGIETGWTASAEL